MRRVSVSLADKAFALAGKPTIANIKKPLSVNKKFCTRFVMQAPPTCYFIVTISLPVKLSS
jgi:hypothetical protein